MDEDIKSVLQEIANELKERNHMARESTARSEERLKERGRSEYADPEKQNEWRVKSEESAARWKERREARSEFEKNLIGELRRLNSNLEAIVDKGSTPLL